MGRKMMKERSVSSAKIEDPNAVRDQIPEGGVRPILARAFGKGRQWFGGDRFEGVSNALVKAIEHLRPNFARAPSLLDFGCGNMAISGNLRSKGMVSEVSGVDTYVAPADDEKYLSYTQIKDASELPFENSAFDLTICVDVLHHIGIEESSRVLRELGRVSRFVIVKDHFEYGFISRQLLRLADWYGNYAYGVNVPDRYFDSTLWERVVSAAEMEEIKILCPVRVHNGFFGFIVLPRNHFVSILAAKR